MPNIPIVNAGELYVNGLALTHVDDENVTIGAGSARNSTNVNDIVLDAAVTVDATVVGANGIDTGAFANSTMYAVYAIGDSTGYQSAAGLYSANLSSPALPGGYDMFRRIGWVLTDGTADILAFYQNGDGVNRSYYYDVGISELSAGSDTSFTAIDLATSVPPLATDVFIDIAYTPALAASDAHFLPFGSSATDGIVRFGCGVAAAQNGSAVVPATLDSSVPKILYKVVASDSLTVLVTGFKDILS